MNKRSVEAHKKLQKIPFFHAFSCKNRQTHVGMATLHLIKARMSIQEDTKKRWKLDLVEKHKSYFLDLILYLDEY